jgi:hypothetical protein
MGMKRAGLLKPLKNSCPQMVCFLTSFSDNQNHDFTSHCINQDFCVRRGKALHSSGCESRPARSLQPVAIGAVVEATKRLKPSV